jgi:hypothetical protein
VAPSTGTVLETTVVAQSIKPTPKGPVECVRDD